jgi:hypothetical protein
MEDAGSSNVDVAESDGLATFETDEEVDSGVGAALGEVPDALGEVGVISKLAGAVEVVV